MSRENLIIENASIGWRNFSGEEQRYNPKGRRNFCVFLDEDTANRLIEAGWNVKTRVKDEDTLPIYYLSVAVNFDNIPPKIIMVTSRNKVRLDENTVGQLDSVDIRNVDLTITPYYWTVNEKSGIKAYLKTMYVTILEDEYEAKYADIGEDEPW